MDISRVRTEARQGTWLGGIWLALLASFSLSAAGAALQQDGEESTHSPTLEAALQSAESWLEAGNPERAGSFLQRALERDPRDLRIWTMLARWAEQSEDLDEEIYSLHRRMELAQARRLDKQTLESYRAELFGLDPLAADLFELRDGFVERLLKLAERYEEEGRNHSAIAVHREILALDPERTASSEAIERIATAPDPSLAEFAKPRDLFADISEAEIQEFDDEHGEWKGRGVLKRENYVTHTDAGYRTMVICAEAMEQMNAFYREFFQYGTEEHGGSVPSIELRIFKNRDEYLELGSGPPAEWSGGQFTGGSVETYVTGGDLQGMFGTLFHEAAHQFVSLSTNAVGWLNEGLASFFEGSVILPNGTVETNEPADHRLFPLARRMEQGWMSEWHDGYDPNDSNSVPEKAPTFRIIVENNYPWGPAWYAPTWGIVYFLHNYQDPIDGRFIYRAGLREFLKTSGGRVGSGAVDNFQETVLANPAAPFKDVEVPEGLKPAQLAETVEELDEIWGEWVVSLREERLGRLEVDRAYFRWAKTAVAAKEYGLAKEHFEKAVRRDLDSAALRFEFAELLHTRFKASDRAARLCKEALLLAEGADEPDAEQIKAIEKLLAKADPKYKSLRVVREELLAGVRNLVQRYRAAGHSKMVMHLSWRFGTELGDSELFELYAEAARESKKSLLLWRLAYNENNLDGWSVAQSSDVSFQPDGELLRSQLQEYDPKDYSYQVLALDELISGDFSLEAEVLAQRGKVGFCGLNFGRKGANDFHSLLFFPPKEGAKNGYLDLASFYDGADNKTWRHVPVATAGKSSATSSARYHKLRIDVSGALCDFWFDDTYQGTMDFGSKDVMRGSLGLVTSRGSASFKNVRFRTSHPRDPSARIERDVRLGDLVVAGVSNGGSFLGETPPWPKTKRWVQSERSSWSEVGRVPQVLVFWSIAQNDLIPLHGWMTELAERHAGVGLQVVSICSPNDDAQVEAYLREHPMPGAVAVDNRDEPGIGDSFTTFAIDKFFLPRVLLMDIDGKVLWEGEPGFERANPWSESVRSFVHDPLEDLIVRRKLRELHEWKQRFESADVVASLSRGDVAAVADVLNQAADLDRRSSAEVAFAQDQRAALIGALEAFGVTAASLTRAEAEPALDVLLEWGEAFEFELDKARKRKLKSALSSRHHKQWATLLKSCSRFEKKAKSDPKLAAQEIIDGGARLGGHLVNGLKLDLQQALDAEDWELFANLCTEAPQRPKLWLAAKFFNW